MYTAISKDSSKILTETTNIDNRNGNNLLTSTPVSGFVIGHAGFFDHPIWVVGFKNNSMVVFYLFNKDFRSQTNNFSAIN